MDEQTQNMADRELPWPSMADKATLRIVAAGSSRSAGLARFLAASFLALALLFLLVGLSKRHHAALAGAGGFLLAAASCFAASRPARPVLLLNREKGEILLSRRWLGRLKFRAFPADQIDLRAERNGSFCRLRIVPRLGNSAGGRSLVNGSSHPLDVSDKAWQAGMLLTCRADAGPISDMLRACCGTVQLRSPATRRNIRRPSTAGSFRRKWRPGRGPHLSEAAPATSLRRETRTKRWMTGIHPALPPGVRRRKPSTVRRPGSRKSGVPESCGTRHAGATSVPETLHPKSFS